MLRPSPPRWQTPTPCCPTWASLRRSGTPSTRRSPNLRTPTPTATRRWCPARISNNFSWTRGSTAPTRSLVSNLKAGGSMARTWKIGVRMAGTKLRLLPDAVHYDDPPTGPDRAAVCVFSQTGLGRYVQPDRDPRLFRRRRGHGVPVAAIHGPDSQRTGRIGSRRRRQPSPDLVGNHHAAGQSAPGDGRDVLVRRFLEQPACTPDVLTDRGSIHPARVCHHLIQYQPYGAAMADDHDGCCSHRPVDYYCILLCPALYP